MKAWIFFKGAHLRVSFFVFLMTLHVAGLAASSAFSQERETPDQILLFGLKAYQDKFYSPSADALARFLNVRPEGQRAENARYFLAEALRHAKRIKEAISVHRDFLRLHSGNRRAPKIQFQLAGMLQKLGDNSGAARVYASIPTGPFRAESVYRVAKIRLKFQEWGDAALALKEFVELLPNDSRVEMAEFERARAIEQLKRYEESEILYQSIVDRYPKSPRSRRARLRLGFIQLHLKKHAQAEASLRDVMNRNPEDASRPELPLALAASLYAQKKYQKAAVVFEDVLSLGLSPGQRRKAMRGAADSWWVEKEYQHAANAYRRIIARDMGVSKLLGRFFWSIKYSGGCGWSGREALQFANGAARRGAELTPEDRLLFAGCLQASGMQAEALEQYRIVVKSSSRLPVGFAANLKMAELLEKSNHLADATLKFEELLSGIDSLKDSEKKAHPELLAGLYQGALRITAVYFQNGKCKPAVRLALLIPRTRVPVKNRAEMDSLRAECAFRLGQFDKAGLKFRKVLAGTRRPKLISHALLRLAEIAEAQGDKKAALQRIKEALPHLATKMRMEAQLNVGRLYREIGKLTESRAFLLPLAKDEKGNPKRRREIWLLLAHDFASAGEWTKADESLEYWNTLSPSDWQAGQILWAQVLFQLGHCSRAAEMAKKALIGKMEKPRRLSLLRISVLCLLKEKNFSEASTLSEEILVLNPEDAEVSYQLGAIFEKTSEFGRAANAYESFVERFPYHPLVTEAALRLGILMESEGNRKAALEAYRIASHSSRKKIYEPARYKIALDLENRGMKNEALASFGLLASGNLSTSKWCRAAGWRAAALLERRGDWKRALAYYSRIGKIIPADGAEDGPRVREGRRAVARANRIVAYLNAIKDRKEKIKNQVPLFR